MNAAVRNWFRRSEQVLRPALAAAVLAAAAGPASAAPTAGLRVLLVDDDWSANNANPRDARLSPSDTVFRQLAADAVGGDPNSWAVETVAPNRSGPALDVLRNYSLILWYTGSSYGGNPDNTAVVSIEDEKVLRRYLEEVGGAVVLFSPGYVGKVLGIGGTWEKGTWTFLNEVLGLRGGRGLVQRFQAGTVTGNPGVAFQVGKGSSAVESQFSAVNPATATPLFSAEIAAMKTPGGPVPVATVAPYGRGRIVYVGFTFENLAPAELAPAFRQVLAATGAASDAARTARASAASGAVTNAPAREPAATPVVASAPGDVLVAVRPAGESLTRATHERLVQFIEWTFKAPLTPSQRARLGEIIVADWRVPAEREGLKEWLAIADHVDTLAVEQRPFFREKLLEEAVSALRAQAATDADARWFVALYDAANEPIAAGEPALTRQMSDATIEMTYFVFGKAHGAELQPSAAEKGEWAAALAASWPGLDEARRREIAGSPLQWAEVRAAWDAASAADRATVAAQWRNAFPLPEAATDAPPAERAASAKLEEIEAYLAKPAAEWRADDLVREADALAGLAARLRADPAATTTAERLAQVEKSLRDAGQRLRTGATATNAAAGQGASQAVADLNRSMMAAQMQQQAFRSQMQFMEQMRQSQFNMIQNMGNSPYRYVNSFGY